MKKLVQFGAACALLLAVNSASLAWGDFSTWTTSVAAQSTAVCTAKRSTGSRRYGLASVYIKTVNGLPVSIAFAQNTTGNDKGADLWLQTANARGGDLGPETQGFNIVPGSFIFLTIQTPIPTTMARCAVQ